MPLGVLASLRGRLLTLILLTALPAVGAILYITGELRAATTIAVHDSALRTVKLASARFEQATEGVNQLLAMLVRLPEIRHGDARAGGRLLADLLRQHPFYANLGVIARNGRLECSALPMREPVELGDRAYFQRALESGKLAIGDYRIGRVSRRATANFGRRVLDEHDAVRAVAFVAVDLAWLSRLAAEADLPAGSTLSVFDRHGTVLAHYPEPERWVGSTLPDAPVVSAVFAEGGEGVPWRCWAWTACRVSMPSAGCAAGDPRAPRATRKRR